MLSQLLFVLHYFVLQEMAVYMAIASHKRCAFEIHKNCIKYHHLNVRINVSVMHKLERGKKNERETCLPPSPRLCLFSPFFFFDFRTFFYCRCCLLLSNMFSVAFVCCSHFCKIAANLFIGFVFPFLHDFLFLN